jgi:hypothetical protein
VTLLKPIYRLYIGWSNISPSKWTLFWITYIIFLLTKLGLVTPSFQNLQKICHCFGTDSCGNHPDVVKETIVAIPYINLWGKHLDFSTCIKTKKNKMADIIEEFNAIPFHMNENFGRQQ